jgi:hypothetical protein
MALCSIVMFLEREVFKGKWFRFSIGGSLLLLAMLWYLFVFSG